MAGLCRREPNLLRCCRDALQVSLSLPTNRSLQCASRSAVCPSLKQLAFENGQSALLLLIRGTIPVQFRGATYRFPVDLWVPHAYPREGIFAYVVPSADMLVRPGQHVGGDGRIYHPYLAQWAKYWDVRRSAFFFANFADLAEIVNSGLHNCVARRLCQRPARHGRGPDTVRRAEYFSAARPSSAGCVPKARAACSSECTRAS